MSPFRKARTAARNVVDGLDHQNRVWLAISVMLVILLATVSFTAISFKASLDSKDRSAKTADCVNDVLALRQNTAASDARVNAQNSQINAAIFRALGNVLSAPSGLEQQAAYEAFNITLSSGNATLAANQITLATNQKFREQHPLGVC